MKSAAKRYIEKRNRSLASSGSTKSLNTELAGVTVSAQEALMREQELSDEAARMTAQGLVPVAIDFANAARVCGVNALRDEQTFAGPNSWVPAWYVAAWHSFKSQFGEPLAAGSPTTQYREFIDSVSRDPKEQVMLVAEFQLTAPFQGAETVAGVHAWLEANANFM